MLPFRHNSHCHRAHRGTQQSPAGTGQCPAEGEPVTLRAGRWCGGTWPRVTVAALQEHPQGTGTGVRQAGSLLWSRLWLHWTSSREMGISESFNGVTAISSIVSVLPDSRHLGEPAVFPPLFQGCFVDSDLW